MISPDWGGDVSRGDRWAASAILVLIIIGLIFINLSGKRPVGQFTGAEATIEISSTPSGAFISLDGMGNSLGETPKRVPVLAGSHNLILYKPGYERWEIQFTVFAGDELKVPAELVPLIKQKTIAVEKKHNAERAAIIAEDVEANLSNNKLSLLLKAQGSDSYWGYQYANNTWGDALFEEHFAIWTPATGIQEASNFTIVSNFTDPGGSAGRISARMYNEHANLLITKYVALSPGDTEYFVMLYVISNNGSTPINDLRFFQTIDYDIPYTGIKNAAWYNATLDYMVMENPSYFKNGFSGSIHSTRHGIDNWSNELYNDWDDGNLNNVDSLGATQDNAVGLQWNLGDLAPMAGKSIELTFWFGTPLEEASIVSVSWDDNNKINHSTENYRYADNSEAKFVRRGNSFKIYALVDNFKPDTNPFDKLRPKLICQFMLGGTNVSWYPHPYSDGINTSSNWVYRTDGAIPLPLTSYSIVPITIWIPDMAEITRCELEVELSFYDGLMERVTDTKGGSWRNSEFYVIFNPQAEMPFATTDYIHPAVRVLFFDIGPVINLQSFEEPIWNLTMNWISGSRNVTDAVERITHLARTINGQSTFHHVWGDETGMMTWNEYDDDKDGTYDEPDENWPQNWQGPWVDVDGDSWPETQTFWYTNTLDFVRKDFDPHNLYNHSHPVGVCEDYGELSISFLRSIGIPARHAWGVDLTYPSTTVIVWAHLWTQFYNNSHWNHLDSDYDYKNTSWDNEKFYWYKYADDGLVFHPVILGRWVYVREGNPSGSMVNVHSNYEYAVRPTDITWDQSSYSLGSPVNANVSVYLDTRKEPHLQVIRDSFAIILILPVWESTTVFDEAIYSAANFTHTLTVPVSFTMPDFGFWNWAVWAASSSLRARGYYNVWRTDHYERVYLDEYTETIPGFSISQTPRISVDGGSSIEFPLINATSQSHFSNESASRNLSFWSYNSTPLKLELNSLVFASKNYTTTNIGLTNTGSSQHNYTLTIPLYALGNAVFIPGVGNVTTDTTFNTSASYLIFYNNTLGTAGNVSIYLFSKNITLTEAQIFEYRNVSMVNVTGSWEFSQIANQTNFFRMHFTRLPANNQSFEQFVQNLSEEIVTSNDSLVDIELQTQESYVFGNQINVTVNLTNNGVAENVTLNLLIHSYPLIPTAVYNSSSTTEIYNESQTLPVAANAFNQTVFSIDLNSSLLTEQLGRYLKIHVKDDTDHPVEVVDPLNIVPGFEAIISHPETVNESQDFTLSVTVNNTLSTTLSNVLVILTVPTASLSQPANRTISSIAVGASQTLAWTVSMNGTGNKSITAFVTAGPLGSRQVASHVYIASGPKLYLSLAAPDRVMNATSFELNATVMNTGDYSLSGVTATLLLGSIGNTSNNTRSIGTLAADSNATINWTIDVTEVGAYSLFVSANDSTGAYTVEGWNYITTYSTLANLSLASENTSIRSPNLGSIAHINMTLSNYASFTDQVEVLVYPPSNMSASVYYNGTNVFGQTLSIAAQSNISLTLDVSPAVESVGGNVTVISTSQIDPSTSSGVTVSVNLPSEYPIELLYGWNLISVPLIA